MPQKSLDDYPDILTAALVAEMLDMNLDYIRKLSREDVIPAHKMPGGRVFRYFKDEIVVWLRDLPSHDGLERAADGVEPEARPEEIEPQPGHRTDGR